MENLNAKNIKRGLACCKGSYDCFTCDIYKRGCSGWREGLAKDALALINSQEQRIKELTEDVDWSAKRILEADKKLASQREEIRRLQNCIHNLKQSRTTHRENAERVGKQLRDVLDDKAKLTEENERLRAENENKCKDCAGCLRWKCDCANIEAYTVSEVQTRFALRYGTYTDKDMTPITEVFRLLDQIAKEMVEGGKDNG